MKPEPTGGRGLPHIFNIPGWTDQEVSALYQEMAAAARPTAVFVEVGVWLGRSLVELTIRTHYYQPAASVWGIDPLDGRAIVDVDPEAERIVKEAGGSLLDAVNKNLTDYHAAANLLLYPSPTAAQFFEQESVDFIFLDGDHSYPAVLRDLHAWHPKLRDGGILAGHDADLPAVQRALTDFGVPFTTNKRVWRFPPRNTADFDDPSEAK